MIKAYQVTEQFDSTVISIVEADSPEEAIAAVIESFPPDFFDDALIAEEVPLILKGGEK